MATAPSTRFPRENDYPSSDGRPMAETDWHRDLMLLLIEQLKVFFAPKPRVYVSGNLLIFYVPGNKRRHIAPDVFVVKGVAKHQRPNYLVWEERKAPDVVFELTSTTTRREDLDTKFQLYEQVLRVKEYILFDPLGDYLVPPLQGFRLQRGSFQPIPMVDGRLPSKVLGLHLERDGRELRLWDPTTGQWLPTPQERVRQVEAENERLRRELEVLRRRFKDRR